MVQQNPAILIKDSSLRLGQRDIWRDMQLSIAPGEFIAILGPNGAGKSSFLKVLLGLYSQQGSVQVLGSQPGQAREHIGYIPQQKAFDRDILLTGRDLIALGITGTQWWLRPTSLAVNQKIDAAITEVGAQAFANKPLGQLSGGEQQRLRIAQAIVGQPKLLLCDEPLL